MTIPDTQTTPPPTIGGATTVPAKMARRLLSALKQELILQHRLLGVAAQTRVALVERQAAAIHALHAQHAALLSEAEQAASARMDLSCDIARQAGLPTARLTLSQVADCCPARTALLIGATRAMLVEVASAVHDSHQLNQQLLENELDYIRDSIDVLAKTLWSRNAGATGAPAGAGAPRPAANALVSLMLDRAA